VRGLYFSAKIDDQRTLYLAPLTDRHLAMAEPLENIDGYFLFEKRGEGDLADIEIIAHIPTEDGVLRLRGLLGMS
jgi:hypothetical protein